MLPFLCGVHLFNVVFLGGGSLQEKNPRTYNLGCTTYLLFFLGGVGVPAKEGTPQTPHGLIH